MAGRICQICADAELAKRAGELIAQRLPDIAIAEQLGLSGHAGRMAVSRHRRRHVIAPAQALIASASKGRDVVERRKATLEAAEAGDEVATFLGLEAITRDARGISKDLKKARKATKAAGQYSVMTGIVGQEHKSLELRSKLGNLPGFVPKQLLPGISEGVPFNLTINFSGGKTERINATVEAPDATPAPPALIEHEAALADYMSHEVVDRFVTGARRNSGAPTKPGVEQDEDAEPDQVDDNAARKLARAFGHK